jgi:hypothetical protein
MEQPNLPVLKGSDYTQGRLVSETCTSFNILRRRTGLRNWVCFRPQMKGWGGPYLGPIDTASLNQ